MKTLFIFFVAASAASPSVFAQSEPYRQAMNAAIGTMNTMSPKTSPTEFQAVANQFERIAGAEPAEWLPRYYAGLLYVYAGFTAKSEADKDKFLDQADVNLKAAETLSGTAPAGTPERVMRQSDRPDRPDNDELAVLKAYIAQARMTVDPANRWQQYGPLFQAGIERAKSLNPNNPRAYLLQGSGLLYTPEQFGGGPGAACPVLKQAAGKFATFKPASDLHPAWGRMQLEPMLEKCPK